MRDRDRDKPWDGRKHGTGSADELQGCAMRKSAPSPEASMDIEQINAIGAKLADLTERTQALRGYL